MKPPPAIPYDKLMDKQIPLANLRRLAASLGIETGKWVGWPDERHQIACELGRWYKSHPVPKRSKRTGR